MTRTVATYSNLFSALAFIEFNKADEKENLIAAADAELRQQKAEIERQRMEEELVRVAADEEDDQGLWVHQSS